MVAGRLLCHPRLDVVERNYETWGGACNALAIFCSMNSLNLIFMRLKELFRTSALLLLLPLEGLFYEGTLLERR
jgi:hypothetical protein